ncbi:sulfurtransferase TusA family protein [Thalassovita taeanensis]|nr:sulfurtransferase TusA family protein [Thalassovita taeanensis]
MNSEIEIDTIGMLCPLPVLKLRKALLSVQPGTVVQLLADDPVAVIDIPHYCSETGHTFLGMETADAHQIFRIRCGAQSPLT